jgi:hypothetical protein
MKTRLSRCLLAAAILYVLFQLFWFVPKSIHQIDYDGMAYTGIARHLRQGQFHAAINAFRSPLLSWIIAITPIRNLLLAGKFANIASLLVCGVLLYVFAWRLWHSRLTASIAVLMFAFARGFVPSAVGSVVPDFLFADLTLIYFILLLECLRRANLRHWFYLGSVHGLAYLAKAFALPWLALCTIVAALLSGGTPRQRLVRLTSAALIPVLAAGAWAIVLHSKYEVYTTGTQLRTNLLQWTLRAYRDHHDPTYSVLRDTTKEVDEYVVDDPMPPGSWPWTYRVTFQQAFPKILQAERFNVPQVLKEIFILITPGGVLAFAATLFLVTRRRSQLPVESQIVSVIFVATVSLLFTYSMLVFDMRYLFPLIPLQLAIAARFLVPDSDWNLGAWCALAIALVVLGTIASIAYSSSPFRKITRDFQASCYNAGAQLRAHTGSTVVSVGSGPFPEHGVGWEAGYKSAYFGDRHLIGALDNLPTPAATQAMLADLTKAAPNAIMVWGTAHDPNRQPLMQSLSSQYPNAVSQPISDPALGTVGTILFMSNDERTSPHVALSLPFPEQPIR